jgi:phenylalanyl-tRNA synthetase alpha chain
MNSEEDKTGKTLAELGVSRTEEVSSLFAEIRQRFDAKSIAARDESTWKEFRDAWLGRKSGVLTRITDNWLKPATPELKRAVGQELNTLRAHVETKIEERRTAIEAGAEEASLAREGVDLSLPGVIRPVGSHHLIRQVLQEVEDIFFSIGFSVVEGPEIETPYYNAMTWTPFIWSCPRARPSLCFSARTLRPCRFAPWRSASRPSA